MNGFLGVTHFDYPHHLTVQQHYQDPACLAKCVPMMPLHLFSWHIFQYAHSPVNLHFDLKLERVRVLVNH